MPGEPVTATFLKKKKKKNRKKLFNTCIHCFVPNCSN